MLATCFRYGFALCLAALFSAAGTGAAGAALVYVYVDPAGQRLMTDRPPNPATGYRLIRQYTVDAHSGRLQDKPLPPVAGPRPVASQYDRLILDQAAQIGLEPALLKAVVHAESSFNRYALSSKGARGLMQLMPQTALRYGVEQHFDPQQSLDGGGRYLRDLLQLFDHDIRLALAAYNAGENAVARYNGIPPYAETTRYVQKTMHLLEHYRRTLDGT